MSAYSYLRALALAKSGHWFQEFVMAAMMTGARDEAQPLLSAYPQIAKEVAERSQRIDHWSPTFDDVKK